ncbi:26S proteasome non-ATPase regulatory subunit 5-like [Aricia agestis]|uniref:26S proteasome non-ATPase regulatory subunit 5-like n=1 Tax=Aricia agestis TaxID=91739 RepID=UPI001C20485A|nr:26S proteasome non-ATPase regulatory subunit 5-like [Aricia agestis]
MSMHMQNAKKKTQEEMRRLMLERKNKDKKPQKINNPLAKYNNLGQLTCILCSSIVRSENVWQVHLNSKQHRENIEKAKKLKELTNNFTEGKIKRPGPPISDAPQEKKPKGILKNAGTPIPVVAAKPKNNAPTIYSYHEEEIKRVNLDAVLSKEGKVKGKLGDTQNESSTSQEDQESKVQDINAPIPEGFFDDPILDAKARNIEYKDPIEEEWEKFQKEIKNETSTSAEIIAGEQEEATAERQIDEIDEQIRNWSRVLDLELKKEETKKKIQDVEMASGNNDDNDSDNEADLDEFLDWRAKKAVIDLTTEVLKKCFEKFDGGDIIQSYPTYFMYLLRHEAVCVQELAVMEVHKALTKVAYPLRLPQFIDVFVAVAQLVCHKDVGLANKAIMVTSILEPEAYPKVLEEMKIGLDYPASLRCNLIEVIINISAKSAELFQLCVEHEYISYMISELNTEDFLYQINILELLAQLAIKPYGINYLVECGAIQKIVGLIEDLERNPLKNLLVPGYMRFFGSIAYHYPKDVLEKYPILTDLLFNAIESNEQVILLIALDTLGFIGATHEGKMSLAALGSSFQVAVDRVCKYIRNSSSVVKVRATHCLSSLIAIDRDPNKKTENVDQRITLMTREWFRCLKQQNESIEYLFELCKNPFSDIKLAGFALLDAICQHNWGQEMIAGAAGFIEYLLDRPGGFSKEEKEAKFDVIKKLATSTVFDANIVARCQVYVDQGPLFKDTIMEVAYEESD